MKELIQLTLAGGAPTTIPCPPGKRIRILNISGSLAVAATLGEQVLVGFVRGGILFAFSVSDPIAAETQSFNAGLALPNTACDLNGGCVSVTLALPDIWWLWDITVSAQAAVATTADCLLLYERTDT